MYICVFNRTGLVRILRFPHHAVLRASITVDVSLRISSVNKKCSENTITFREFANPHQPTCVNYISIIFRMRRLQKWTVPDIILPSAQHKYCNSSSSVLCLWMQSLTIKQRRRRRRVSISRHKSMEKRANNNSCVIINDQIDNSIPVTTTLVFHKQLMYRMDNLNITSNSAVPYVDILLDHETLNNVYVGNNTSSTYTS